MGVTVNLLKQMISGEPLSPTDFSGSVHHAAAGYLGIAAGNRHPMRAVAGGAESFCYGFLDAVGLLADSPAVPVLLIAAEDQVPPPFDASAEAIDAPAYAAAFLLTRGASKDSPTVSLKIQPSAGASTPARVGIPALDFLQWLDMEKQSFEICFAQKRWRWEK